MQLKRLVTELKKAATVHEKLEILDQKIDTTHLSPFFHSFLSGLSADCQLVLKSLMAIGQWNRLTEGLNPLEASERLRALIVMLRPVEQFYKDQGGIVGYQSHFLELLSSQANVNGESSAKGRYHQPLGMNMMERTEALERAIEAGIRHLPIMAEIYPVGGAADRLRLIDPESKVPLPAARLNFCGKTLLESLICDLQAREYLHYKLYGKQVITPVAMMTSQEKDNHDQILSLCREKKWFGRPASSFAFFCQPTVPTMNKDGNWCLLGPCNPLMKPGGHGVMWKVAQDQGIFDWFESFGRKKVLVRQINNPIAGCDYGLIAFTGIGCEQDKFFGFASCLRRVGAAEGINVLLTEEGEGGTRYCLTNIEYCDFSKYGIDDQPVDDAGQFSKFPSNTNILFADLKQIALKVSECPIPGMLVNCKKIAYVDENGDLKEEEVGRLESMMQNIADTFAEQFETSAVTPAFPELRTFLTYNERRKTISTAKREFQEGGSLLETPEGCYRDHMENVKELLSEHCQFQIPETDQFDFLYHPALGPLYQRIAEKIQRGRIAPSSECVLEIAELTLRDLLLEGSLLVYAERVMGHEERGSLVYSDQVGRCCLERVKVVNRGIDRTKTKSYWKSEIARFETCEIRLKGRSELIARDVELAGAMQIVVEDGFRMIAYMESGVLRFKQERL